MTGGVDGIALGAAGAGALFLYAAVSGKTVLGTLQALIKGQAPSAAAAAPEASLTGSYGSSPAAGGAIGGATSGGAAGVTDTTVPSGGAQSALQQAAAAYGWGSGPEWQALNWIEMHEAGYNPNATNPSSGAYGIAQALGHGGANTAGTAANQYGGFGLTDAQARAANSGDAGAQALWMVNYIKAVYGSPSAAQAQYYSHPGGVGYY